MLNNIIEVVEKLVGYRVGCEFKMFNYKLWVYFIILGKFI